MITLERSPEEEAAWLEFRRCHITATDVADAANGTYGGAFAVVARKLGRLEVEQNDQMARGHRWQPVVADAVHVLTGLYVVGEETICEHPLHSHHSATVDGFLADVPEATADQLAAVVEVKTRGVGVRPNRDRWADQVQWQMWVTGQRSALIAEATIDDDTDTCRGVTITPMVADPDRQAVLVDVADTLWSYVTDGQLPPVDTASALPVVKQLTGTVDPAAEVVDLSELAEDVTRFHRIKAAVKAVTDERDELEARIRAAIGASTKGTCRGFTVTVSKPTNVLDAEAEADLLAARPDLGRLVLDRDVAKKTEPDLYEAARRPIGARRITLKETS